MEVVGSLLIGKRFVVAELEKVRVVIRGGYIA